MRNKSYQEGYAEGFKKGYEKAMKQIEAAVDPKVSFAGSIEKIKNMVRKNRRG